MTLLGKGIRMVNAKDMCWWQFNVYNVYVFNRLLQMYRINLIKQVFVNFLLFV
jgi:hypothetical protein